MKSFHLHLVSDSTGETVGMVARACLVQFQDVDPVEHLWPMVRSETQVRDILHSLDEHPGFVIYTLVDEKVRLALEEGCRERQIPCLAVLDPIVAAFGAYLNATIDGRPGRQHVMDAEYFDRIEAMHYVLSHDDGQQTDDLAQADVIVLGVSRTSKTPTCIYLANRGIKAANVPVVPGCPVPEEVFKVEGPLKVGLTKDPKRLVEIRRQRLKMIGRSDDTDYVDVDMVTKEISEARRLYNTHGWPVINVSRKSIEETAATIIQLLTRRQESVG